MKISYLIPGDVFGRVLVVLNRETGRRDTLTNHVLNYTWLGDSETLALEVGGDGPREVFTVNLMGDTARSLALGSFPAGFPQGQEVVFTGLVGDRLDGLFVCSPGQTPTRISNLGTRAAPAGMNRILAQDSTGLIEIVR
ncbi:hypothetical protein EHM69_04160 [candidate division KSB1 bacterium]|nr:MAG: hypothetical protein EHM69_04160 [candidate division KSB1 bacterium]